MGNEILTLNHYVDKAVDFFANEGDYALALPESRHTLVVGSQNGYYTGRLLYRKARRAFSHAMEALAQEEIDAKSGMLGDVAIVSATGSRNVVPIAEYAISKNLPVTAILCNPDSALKRSVGDSALYREVVVRAIDEPPTINTATYGRMIQGVTHENMGMVRQVLSEVRESRDFFGGFEKFTMLLPDSVPEVAAMADWKMNEIFGRQRGSRAMFLTNAMHGAGVCDSDDEAYISIGVENKYLGEPKRRLNVNVPDGLGPLGFMLASYCAIGHIQEAKCDTMFRDNIMGYKARSGGWNWESPTKRK